MSRRRWRLAVSAVIIVGFLWVALWAAPMQVRNNEECIRNGGFYVFKSMQCVTGHGIENMIGKNIDK